MSRLNDYPIPPAFKPGKTVIMDPVTPFRLREGELEFGKPFSEEEGRPVLVNPYSMGVWDLPPAHMTVGTDPVSQWSAIPLGDEAHGVVYFEGWAFACLSVWTLDSKAIRRRAGDLHMIGLGADIGLAQLTIECARYAPRKVARHFVAIHLATGTVVGDGPAVDAVLIELRNRNNRGAEWVNRVAMLWRAVAREDAGATLAAMVRARDVMLVSPAPGALESFEADGGAPAREKATLDMSEVGDITVSSNDGERGFAKVSTMVTDLGWADATVDRGMSLSWEPADTKRMDPDHALLAQLKAALLAHCALEALVWVTLRLKGGTDSTLTRWVEVQLATAEGEEVQGAAPVQTTIMASLAALKAAPEG